MEERIIFSGYFNIFELEENFDSAKFALLKPLENHQNFVI